MESTKEPLDWRDDPRLGTRWTLDELNKPVEYLYTHYSVGPRNVDRQAWIDQNVKQMNDRGVYTMRDWVMHIKR